MVNRLAHSDNPGPTQESGPRGTDGTEASGSLVPEQRISLLDSSGEFTCPHCEGTIRIQGVGLRFEGAGTAETVKLDLRHPGDALDEVVDDVRRVLVIRALREAHGVKARAAEIAGMKYTTFYELVRRLGITDGDINA